MTRDLAFDSATLGARVIFAGTHCGRENLLRAYTSGSMHFIRRGRAKVRVDGGETVLVEQPSLVFFPRAHRHALCALDPQGIELVCAITHFSEAFQRCVALFFPAMVVVPLSDLAPVRHAVEAFFAEALAAGSADTAVADRLCSVVLAYVVRHLCATGFDQGVLAAAGDKGIAAALHTMHTRHAETLDLGLLAGIAAMSRSRFVERFKQLVGTSPHNYLVNYRIGVAQQLLARNVPVKAVAGRVGYETTAAFVRKFKEVVGLPPAAWARQRRLPRPAGDFRQTGPDESTTSKSVHRAHSVPTPGPHASTPAMEIPA